jgi:uncharacterized repeat protein (TIGR01451 family)
VGNYTNITSTVTATNGPSGNQATAGLMVLGTAPDLTIAKVHTGNFTQGQNGAAYTITVTNLGQTPAAGLITVTDTLPAGLTLASMTGANWTCGPPNAANVCTRTDGLNAGATYPPIVVKVNVDPATAPSVTNQATVSGGRESNTANDTAMDVTSISTLGDLTGLVTLTTASSFFPPGAIVTITNISGSTIAGPIQVVLTGLTPVQVTNATGIHNGSPYITISPGPLAPGQAASYGVRFISSFGVPGFTAVAYSGSF